MSRIVWDATGEHYYETGVKNCVLYVKNPNGSYPEGVAWNGITAISESPSGAEATPLYADDIKYLNLISNEEFGATVEAYTYPDEFAQCDGSASLGTGVQIGQQSRSNFGLCYRTVLGNDNDGNNYGYKIHIIYNATAAPSEKAYATINDSPEAITFSWELSTNPVPVNGFKPTATVVIDSSKATAAKLAALENQLYGIDAPAFSALSTYAVGDYVTYNSTIYKCKTAISTAGAWDATKWDETVDPSEVSISEFSASKTYIVGEYVTYNSATYRCKTAISTAGAWDATKWQQVVAEYQGPRLPLPNEIAAIFA